MRDYSNYQKSMKDSHLSDKELREHRLICYELELLDKKKNLKFRLLNKDDKLNITKKLKKIYKI